MGRAVVLAGLGILLAGLTSCSETVAPGWTRDRLPVEGEILFLSDRDGGGRHLYIMDENGTEALPRLAGEVSVEDACWSHGGATIAYTVELRYGATDFGTDIYLLDREGSAGWPLVTSQGNDRRPRWSPDDQTLAFLSDREVPGPGIYLIHADGSEERFLTVGPDTDDWGGWSTDGRYLVVAPDSTHPIRVIEVETKDTTYLARGHAPAFAPGDAWIAYHDRGIHLIQPDSSGHVALTAYGDGFRWSPDGARLSFRDTDPYTPYTLEVIAPDGSGHRVLVEYEESWHIVRHHSWRSDGSAVVFSTATGLEGRETALFLASLEDSTVEQITHFSASHARPEWRPE